MKENGKKICVMAKAKNYFKVEVFMRVSLKRINHMGMGNFLMH